MKRRSLAFEVFDDERPEVRVTASIEKPGAGREANGERWKAQLRTGVAALDDTVRFPNARAAANWADRIIPAAIDALDIHLRAMADITHLLAPHKTTQEHRRG